MQYPTPQQFNQKELITLRVVKLFMTLGMHIYMALSKWVLMCCAWCRTKAIIINATKQFAKMFIRFLKNKTRKKVRQYVSNYKVDIAYAMV